MPLSPETALQAADIERLRKDGNMKKFSKLLHSYDALFKLVNRFLYDDSHADDLQMMLDYKQLRMTTDRLMQELLLRLDDASAVKIKQYFIPFPNLLSADKDYHERGIPFDKEKIQRDMRAALGEMKELSMEINAISGIPDDDIEGALKEYRGRYIRISDWTKPDPVKIEITAMPEISVKDAEDNVIHKGNERIHLPKFKSTQWPDITMRFTRSAGTEVVVTIGKNNYPLDYKILGFENEKSEGPNVAWKFLYGIALNGGATPPLEKPIPDDIKQCKLHVTNRFKAIFKNPTNPFYDPSGTADHVYRIKINLLPPETASESPDHLGVREYLTDTMTEVDEPEDSGR